MDPIEFPGHNIVFAKNQPQYRPLPAFRNKNGLVITCWKLTPAEQLRVIETGCIWVSTLTFNHPIHPFLLEVNVPKEVTEAL